MLNVGEEFNQNGMELAKMKAIYDEGDNFQARVHIFQTLTLR